MKKSLEFKQIGKLTPSKDFRKQAKKRLMLRIRQEKSSWLEDVLYDFQKIHPADTFQIMSKERLLSKIARPTSFVPQWVRRFLLNKKFFSLATSFGILFVSIFSFSVYTPQTVEASNSVYLVITNGDPIIKPLGQNWKMAQQLQELNIGDTIQTDHDDIVEIHFFDSSVTRLANNTELTITDFFKESLDEKIELKLKNGRTWNKVIQAVSNSSDFTVNTHNSSVSTKNATFDILAGTNQPTSINVVDHLIDVKILQSEANSVVAKTKVAGGYKVEVKVSSEKTVAQTAQIKPIENEYTNDWFTENKEKDKIHLDNLEKKREEKIIAAAGILPNSPLYPVKKGLEEAKNVITNPDQSTEKLEKITKKFRQAAALSAKAEYSESNVILEEFKNLFQEAKNETALKPQLEKALAEMQNDYTTVLPGTQEYKIKELLRELELQITDQPESVLIKRTAEKLFEAQDLFENGTPELAENLLVSISQNQTSILNSTGAIVAEHKKTFILQKTEELQILQALKEDVKSAESDKLASLVDTIHQNTIQEINKLTPQPKKPLKKHIVTVQKDDPKTRAQEFINKVNIYKTQRGQNNQMLSLLKKIPNNKKQIATLTEIKKLLPVEKQYLITQKILEITNK